MARPNWEYIRVDVLLPEHPKVEELSDKAFRALIDLWCYCGRNRTDGIVTDKRWKATGNAKVRAELVEHGLVEPTGLGGVVMHDYLEHQRSREEIDELSAKRTEAAKKAAAARWNGHAKTHALPHCAEHAKTHAERIPIASCVPMPKAEAEADTPCLRHEGCKHKSAR